MSGRSLRAGTTQDAGVADAGPVTSAGVVALGCHGLLFDADGVLVDSDASIERAWVRWAHHWDHDPAAVLSGIHGRRSDDTVALLVDHADRARALGDIDRFELEDVGAVTACPGAAELLAACPRAAGPSSPPGSGSWRPRGWPRPACRCRRCSCPPTRCRAASPTRPATCAGRG